MLKILILEDDVIWQIKLQVMLEELGYAFVLATSIEEFRQILPTQQPDVILSNVQLSDGSALDFFNNNPPNVPIIFITDVANRSLVEQILLMPFASFYVKPVHILTLMSAVETSHKLFCESQIEEEPAVHTLKVPVRYGRKMDIPFTKICWIEVEENYSTIHTTDRKYVQKLSFKKLLPDLDERFIRIHRAVIVNKDFIDRVNLQAGIIEMSEHSFHIGPSYRKMLISRLNESNHFYH